MEKKVVLVTGTSSGFGKLTAELLAKEGHTVFAAMRGINGKNAKAAEELRNFAKDKNLKLEVLNMDVTNDASVKDAVDKTVKNAGKIDVVVNNAGMGIMGLMESVTIEQAKQQYDVNVFGILRVNRAALPYMRKQKSGLLIHISSGLGRFVMPFIAMYGSTKFAVEAIAEAYHYELKGLGIDSVIIQPGAYPTDFASKGTFGLDTARADEYGPVKDAQDKMFASFGEMFKHAGNPKEIAELVKEYIDMPAGKRPLRMTKGLMSDGAKVINEVCEKVQSQMMKESGL